LISDSATKVGYITVAGFGAPSGDWSPLVNEGIGHPRILLCSPNLCKNFSFEKGLDGWTDYVSHGSLVWSDRDDVYDYKPVNTFFGQKCLLIQDTDPAASYYASYRALVDSTLDNRYFVSLWLKGSHFMIAISTSGWTYLKLNVSVPADTWTFCSLLTNACLVDEGFIDVRVYPAYAADPTGEGFVDNVNFREVYEVIDLVTPAVLEQSWDQTRDYDFIDNVGKWWKDDSGYRYKAKLSFPIITKDEELVRQQVSEGKNSIIFYPHDDSSWTSLVRWAEPHLQSYLADKWVGYAGGFFFESVELVPTKSQEGV